MNLSLKSTDLISTLLSSIFYGFVRLFTNIPLYGTIEQAIDRIIESNIL